MNVSQDDNASVQRREFLRRSVTVAWSVPAVMTLMAGEAGAQACVPQGNNCCIDNTIANCCTGTCCCLFDGNVNTCTVTSSCTFPAQCRDAGTPCIVG